MNKKNQKLTSLASSNLRVNMLPRSCPMLNTVRLQVSGAGLNSSKISRVVNVLNIDIHITPVQCSSILSSYRRHNVRRECHGIIKHFQMKANSDDTFYFSIQPGKDETLRSVFRADGRSRASYVQFGDVLVFDVTYQTNKFKIPFAPFVGVNDHGQTILFGAALLEDETDDTFIWVFEQFRMCMFDKAPMSIITDQDRAILKAIPKVFPGVRHRFCACHINKYFSKIFNHCSHNLEKVLAMITVSGTKVGLWMSLKADGLL